MLCVKYIWGRYKDYNFQKHLSTVYEEIVFQKKNLFLLPSGKAGRNLLEGFQIDERMTARFATERYCIQSNNGNAKSTTSKTIAKIKIYGSPKCIGKKDGALGVKRTYGVTKRI